MESYEKKVFELYRGGSNALNVRANTGLELCYNFRTGDNNF